MKWIKYEMLECHVSLSAVYRVLCLFKDSINLN